MDKITRKLDSAVLKMKGALATRREGNDQLVVMFIIIAVAAGVAALFYIFGSKTLLPNVESKLSNLVDNWFSSK